MIQSPALSIIIPLFNKVDCVQRCITSILEQDYQNYELIIIDDGSTDGSADLVEKTFSDVRLRLFRTTNGGVSSARNKGLQVAEGRYVMFIDADDYISQGYISNIMSQTEKCDADIYIWGITKDRLDGKQVPIVPALSGLYNRHSFFSQFVKEQYVTHKGLYGYAPNKLMKNEVLKSCASQFNTAMKLMEDYDFFLSYYAICRSFYIFDETGYHYVAYPTCPGSLKRATNYIQLIDVHLKCRELLSENDALTSYNDAVMNRTLGRLALSSFLEMKNPSVTKVRSLREQIYNRQVVMSSLSSLNTNKRLLKRWILHKRDWAVYVFIKLWERYLKERTKR